MHYDTSLYFAGCEEKIDVDKAVFWSTVQDKLTRIKNSFVEKIHSFPNLSYPICYYQGGILTMDIHRIFKPSLAQWLFFPPCEPSLNLSIPRIHTYDFNEIVKLRKTQVVQKLNRLILRKMTFANHCMNCCFFAQNLCAMKEKFAFHSAKIAQKFCEWKPKFFVSIWNK